jgi:hypothetical protein
MTAEFAGETALPCPFCGSTETAFARKGIYLVVQCWNIDCQADGPLDLGKSGALAKWNERLPFTLENAEVIQK